MPDGNDAKASPLRTKATAGARLGYTPLYLQVRQDLLDRIIAGTWQPGMALPSEQQLASQMGVSQGTLRKALDALASDGVIVRHQGRGTFVAEHDQRRTLFQFFKIVSDENGRIPPETVYCQVSMRPASETEREALELGKDADIWVILRHRALNGQVALVEDIVLPADRFPQLDTKVPLPNNIYELYERQFSVTVANARERLRAVRAEAPDAEILGCAEGAPLLQIERLAVALDGSAIELRRTRCRTDRFHYISELR
ncbi:GntR family transcriptional regulator [Oricola thermophila]|uniref:GntR family transcriptional regulator n=1 Tax=Oricola thermophila TaxID=2742145 RepID=A0A6N1VGN4_9HYPH|nr:GntR family transcriptional regulator [Oricola thermophila]QKV20070.1 GntR family transcriptional regulator [Oricola thermophila]